MSRLICASGFRGRATRTVPWEPGATALQALKAGGQPIASSCAGDTVCGRCVVRVVAGAHAIAPPDPDEADLLAGKGAAPEERLACRLHPPASGVDVILSTHYW